MFSFKAVLLSVQLSLMCQVFAGVPENRYWDILVFRGDSIMFTCNTSMANVTLTKWTKGRFVFTYSIINNKTFSNFTSHRLRIDSNSSTKLHVINAQCDDEGLYICNVTSIDGPSSVVWNLTVSEVSEKPEELSSSWYFLYILTSVIGLLLCGFAPALCLCRKIWTKTPNQDLVSSRTLIYAQSHLQLGGEVVPAQYQSCVEYRINHKQEESVLQ
ncbi:uncharacterized protein LOC127366059 isoform X2 [Dicentrarchus labrax]|uniref:uncharacterized protein LOC127366059 isoform X2 n=1 Tax=Dicentrarchus labrax TaxID=13489 RepID=UPI0021F52810|nr:uncharacterized protein LOC127366059 isoform X2 [Dicentrarchus labrax]